MMQKKLKKIMELRGYSQSTVARSVGISATALSQWLSGNYPGDSTKINAAVSAFLKREQERMQSPKKAFQFINTEAAVKIFDTLRMCHLIGEMGIITAKAGRGKTVAVKEYAKQNPGTLLIETHPGYTARVLFRQIHTALGFSGGGLVYDMFGDIVERLKESNRLIIIDEAENLPPKALDLIRRVHDMAGVGVVLSGLPRLLTNIKGKNGDFAQLYSRIGIAVKLEGIVREDVQALAYQMFPDISEIIPALHRGCRGSARTLNKLLSRTARLSEINAKKPTPEMVLEAAKTLII